MKHSTVLNMIDDEFDNFEQDRKEEKNLRMLLSFKNSDLNYNEQNFKIPDKPKLKKKLKSSVYIKNKNNNQLF